MKCPLDQVVQDRKLRRTTVSLQEPVGDGDGIELGALLADDAESAPDARVEALLMGAGVRRTVALLPPRERAVIEARYGFGPDGPATVAETARRLRLRLGQVRHLEELALRRLRAAPETAALLAA